MKVILYRRGTSASAGEWSYKTITNQKSITPEMVDDIAEGIHHDECYYGCSEHCRGLTYFLVDKELAELLIREQKEAQKRRSDWLDRDIKKTNLIRGLEQRVDSPKKLSKAEMSMVGTAIGALLDGYEGTSAFTLKELADYRKLKQKVENESKRTRSANH